MHWLAEGFDIAAIARSVDSEGMEILGPEVEKEDTVFSGGSGFSCTKCQKEVVSNILERYGRIDFLVNNAGVAPLQRNDLLDMTEESYDRVLNINLKGPVFFAQKIAKEMIWMRDQITPYKPVIVFITSVSAVLSSVNSGRILCFESRTEHGSTIFADRLSRRDPVCEVHPGIIQTDMTIKVRENMTG